MKKIFLFLILILVILSCIAINIHINNSKDFDKLSYYNIDYNPTFYQTSQKFDNLSNDTSIVIDNLKVTLKAIYFDGIDNENLLKLGLTEDEIYKSLKDSSNSNLNYFIEFSTLDNTNIHELVFEYLIYDNNKNLIASNIGMLNYKTPYYNDFFNKYILNNNNSNTQDVTPIMNANYAKNIIRDNINSTLYLITAEENDETNQELIDLSKVHLLITGINYKDNNANDIDMYNKIYEFVLEK